MQRNNERRTVAGMIIILAAGVAVRGQPPPVTPASAAELDPLVDKILTRLERRAVHDLRAKLKWELTYAIEEDEETDAKFGTIWYKQEQPVSRFKVHFDTKITGSRKQALNEEHLFDGRWYVELQSLTKTVTRREIRREGATSDPYKLGEGAFPLPFGQKKADILAEFEVTRVPPKRHDPPESDHLHLVPRAGTNTGRTYKTLDFWVARAGDHAGLPVKVVAGKKDGTGAVNSYIEITFRDVELNTGFSTSVFKIDVPRDYEEIVERLEPIAAPPARIP
jgi:hypothetical protein